MLITRVKIKEIRSLYAHLDDTQFLNVIANNSSKARDVLQKHTRAKSVYKMDQTEIENLVGFMLGYNIIEG